MRPLDTAFYERDDVVLIARELIGKVLCTRQEDTITKGVIMETEAYAGIEDRASHAYGDRRTARTETMYGRPGTAYVYLCYGIHSLFNVVTNQVGIPHAVLIRGIFPFEGADTMKERRTTKAPLHRMADGPGKLCQALGIDHRLHNGIGLNGDLIWIEDHGLTVRPEWVRVGPRIGVDYAGEDALLPYRFLWEKHVQNVVRQAQDSPG